MTPCSALRLRVAAYADDELGVEGAADVEEHLARCLGCREELERLRVQSGLLRDLRASDAPPPGFEERIHIALFGRARRVVPAAVAAVVLAVVVAAYFSIVVGGSADAVAAAARIHRRADAGEVPLAVRSANAREVNAWLRRKLPFPAAISASRPPEIALEGAAAVRLHGERVGLVRYRIGGSAVSLFLLPRPEWTGGRLARFRGIDFRIFDASGLSLIAWSHPPLSYVLVSDGGALAGTACGVCHGRRETPPLGEFAAVVGNGA